MIDTWGDVEIQGEGICRCLFIPYLIIYIDVFSNLDDQGKLLYLMA